MNGSHNYKLRCSFWNYNRYSGVMNSAAVSVYLLFLFCLDEDGRFCFAEHGGYFLVGNYSMHSTVYLPAHMTLQFGRAQV